ncbi:hypothetical protein [Candidatus Ichthyocystis sparus]|uniref:hypothetical protein n=1 Tax=Candidatus Ichthyocystis sparus TaxID=1561004 RepID=UPI000B881DAC|nr:hypothetical protein [Candidatus Ichthyocystis sparus]
MARSRRRTWIIYDLANGCEDSIKAFAKLISQFMSLSAQIPHDRLLVMLRELFMLGSDDGI